jgi:hypothetical protein
MFEANLPKKDNRSKNIYLSGVETKGGTLKMAYARI